jgi:signal transduction histidine kinase
MFVIPQIGKVIQRAALWTQVITTAVVFAVLLAFAFMSYQNARQTLELQRGQVISQKLASVEDSVNSRMDENGNVSRAGAALFDASEAVTAKEWERFFSKFNVEQRFDGITSIGYAPVIRSNEVDSFRQTLRGQGVNSELTLNPNAAEYAPVMYIKTYRDTQGVYGFDMYSSPERKIAMEQARDTGLVSITDGLALANSQRLGAVLYAPVYVRDAPLGSVEERRAAIRGYVFTGVRIEQLLATVLPEAERDNVGIVVSELRQNSLPKKIYTTVGSEQRQLGLSRSTDITLHGKKWRITLYANDTIVSRTEADRPSTILAGGIAISIIASLAVYLLIQYRTRSFALAEEHKLQQAKDELLSLASHQLRTPATGVKQYVGMVVEGYAGDVSKEQLELLEQAYKSNERQLQIINEFLYVAKLGSGSLTTSIHAFDLVPVVSDVIDEMKGEVAERKHKLTFKSIASAKIFADEHSLRMIIENLISNAVKYTKPGGRISVRLEQEKGAIRLSVQDTGIGIASRDTNLLFKQFSRIPNELSHEVNGSGIGLYLAQQLAERNGGRIYVESEVGQGSTFTLHLPQKTVRKITHQKK